MCETSDAGFCLARVCSSSSAVDRSVSKSGNCGPVVGTVDFAADFFFPMLEVTPVGSIL